MGLKIMGTGRHLPKLLVTNKDLAAMVDTTDEWIVERTGIETRNIAIDETTVDMAASAAKMALKNANLTLADIDVIIATTVTSDYFTPSLACLTSHKIGGSTNAICLDINCACAGFVYAIDMANRYLMDDDRHRALIISSEMLSKMTDFNDRSTCILFGDGAGAVIVEKTDGKFVSFLGADPTGADKLFARGMPPENPFMERPYDWAWDNLPETIGHSLHQDGRAVYTFATKTMPMAVREVCKKANIDPSELDIIFPHQANMRIIETAAKKLRLPLERFFINIQKHGNSSSACIPICLSEAMEQGLIKSGQKVCLVGFGAGLTYGAIMLEW